MAFTARYGTHSFLGGRDLDEVAQRSRELKQHAAAAGRTVKTYTSLTLIQGDTDEQAAETLALFRSGADTLALENIVNGMANRPSGNLVQDMARRFVFFGCQPLLGSSKTIASRLTWLAEEGGLDGVMLCFPDFIEGLERFRQSTQPALAEHGIELMAAR
jgi:pyrimidine oxygenase